MPILLVRHATPTVLMEVLGDAYRLPPGPPLSEAGRREAADTAAVLAEWAAAQGAVDDDRGEKRPVTIWCSPFQRAAETAEPIARALGAAVETLDDLTEEGPHEPLASVRKRVARARERLEETPGIHVVITHGSLLREWLGSLGAVDAADEAQWCWDDCGRATPCPPASVWLLDGAGPGTRLHPPILVQ